MKSLLLAFLAVAAIGKTANADDAIPAKTLDSIKSAVVFVKVQAAGETSSGSGFVIRIKDGSVYVVTNHHVIDPKIATIVMSRTRPIPNRPGLPRQPLSPTPPSSSYGSYTARLIVTSLKNAIVTVVFRSGTKREEAVRGEVLAADPDRDLAVLKVVGVKDPPTVIDIAHDPKLTETMSVYTFGFPFGSMLATGGGNPAMTVGKASISSLRNDDKGELAVVQIDGALNPGNSGGPVVDTAGRLVGVAVATIRNSSGIGLAIPPGELTRMLFGRVGKLEMKVAHEKDKDMLHVDVGLIDPLNKIHSVALHYLPADKVKDRPKGNDPLARLPGIKKLTLKIEGQIASGDIPLTDVSEPTLFQTVYVNGAGKSLTTEIAVHTPSRAAAEIATDPINPFSRTTPVLTGQPSVNVAGLVRHKNGGYQITSSSTRVAEPSAPATSIPFPKPVKQDMFVAGKSSRIDAWQVDELNIVAQKPGSYDRGRAPLVFAPDGKHFYLLDGKGVLHKVAADLTDVAMLETQATCDDISFSKAGLLVAVNSAHVVWVINPDTLEVVREIPVDGLQHVAGSSASAIGFADGIAAGAGQPPFGGALQLSMIDFNSGKVLHRIVNDPRITLGGQGVVENGLLCMQMTNDAKHLFLGGRQIRRYRLEGEDLVYEETSRDLQNGHTTHFVVSGDGKFAAMPTGAGNASNYGIAVLDAMHLDRQLLALENGAYPCAIGFDPLTGNIYSPNFQKMNVFSARGGNIAQIALGDRDVHRIIVSPEGGQFLAWGQSKIVSYRPAANGK